MMKLLKLTLFLSIISILIVACGEREFAFETKSGTYETNYEYKNVRTLDSLRQSFTVEIVSANNIVLYDHEVDLLFVKDSTYWEIKAATSETKHELVATTEETASFKYYDLEGVQTISGIFTFVFTGSQKGIPPQAMHNVNYHWVIENDAITGELHMSSNDGGTDDGFRQILAQVFNVSSKPIFRIKDENITGVLKDKLE